MQTPSPQKPRSVRRYWWAIAAAVVLQAACLFLALGASIQVPKDLQYFFETDMAVMERPEMADLAGTYHLTDDSMSFLGSFSHWDERYRSVPPSTIELRADGTVGIVNMPDCAWTGWEESSGEFFTGSGSWVLSEEWRGYGVDIDTSRDGSGSGSISPWMRVRGFDKPYFLEIVIGDPDNGETLEYVRD